MDHQNRSRKETAPAPGALSRRNLISGIVAAAAVPTLLSQASGTPAGNTRRTDLPPAEALPRSLHSAAVMGDGSVIVTGGQFQGVLADAQIFNPSTGHWGTAAQMNTPRYGHAMAVLSPTTVAVFGGMGTAHEPISDVEIYDAATDTWMPANPLLLPRHQHTATLMGDGSVLIAGGMFRGTMADIEIYIP